MSALMPSDVTVSGPCGHRSLLDLAWVAVDEYCCPECGGEWHVRQAAPWRWPNGWVEPGARVLVLGPRLREGWIDQTKQYKI